MNSRTFMGGTLKWLFSALLLIFSCGISLAQSRVLVHEFKLLNESPEELPQYGQFLKDSAFIQPVLEVLEKGIRSKVGDLPIDYYSGRQIDLLSPKMNPYNDAKDQFKRNLAKQKLIMPVLIKRAAKITSLSCLFMQSFSRLMLGRTRRM